MVPMQWEKESTLCNSTTSRLVSKTDARELDRNQLLPPTRWIEGVHQRCSQCQTLPLLYVYPLKMWLILTRSPATFGYKEEDIVMLTDDAQNPRQVPTKANMVIGVPFNPIYSSSIRPTDLSHAVARPWREAERFFILPLQVFFPSNHMYIRVGSCSRTRFRSWWPN